MIHSIAILQDHELKSQTEERKIRSDAAHEETMLNERALQEEKLPEKMRSEAEDVIPFWLFKRIYYQLRKISCSHN